MYNSPNRPFVLVDKMIKLFPLTYPPVDQTKQTELQNFYNFEVLGGYYGRKEVVKGFLTFR